MLTEEELISAFPACEKIGKKAHEILLKNATKRNFSKGERLPYKSGVRYFFIKRGGVNVLREGENGGEFFLYRVGRDNGCVTSDLLKYEFTASSEIVIFDEECYAQACAGTGGGAYFLSLSRKQEESAVLQFDSIMFSSVERRLSSVLLDASARARSHTLNYTHEQLAGLIGSSREVVTRKLSALCEEGAIEISRGKITVKNKEVLKKKK